MEQKYSLLSHNTFGIDVSAACFLEYASVDELRGLIGSGRVTSPYLHIGGGSNLLFTKDYEGTILHSRIGGVEVVAETDDDIVVRVGWSGTTSWTIACNGIGTAWRIFH